MTGNLPEGSAHRPDEVLEGTSVSRYGRKPGACVRDQRSVQLLSELSRPGRRAARLGQLDVPLVDPDEVLTAELVAERPPAIPELSELDLVRHFVNLSALNLAVDTNFYPLGSCTMKYNPKRHEALATLERLRDVHPLQSEDTVQGLLALLWQLQEILAEIAGLPAVSLQPAAGAQGELTALLMAAAYFRHRGEPRTRVLIPDTAHGTNPASAALAGFECITVRTNDRGTVDVADLRSKLDQQTAVCMLTNPNTLGLFEAEVRSIAELLHACGALLYIDGANMNAILGKCRPGDFGADMMHFNVHKTFTGPHGAGGPGAGPIAVRDFLAPYLPVPVVARRVDTFPDGQTRVTYYLDYERPLSIGKVHGFYGHIGILIRGYCYLRTLGAEGMEKVAENAVLNANYLLSLLKEVYPVPYGDRCMHEFVATTLPPEELPAAMESWRKNHLLPKKPQRTALDVAKRLLDYGFHAPTVYFPLVVPEAMMIEPTETESKETLDAFAAAMRAIWSEDPQLLRTAPYTTPVRRPDEVRAARWPILRWHDLHRME